MSVNTLHFYIIVVAVVVITVAALCLLFVRMPRDKELRNYRISRYMLAAGYLFFAGASLAAVIFGPSHTSRIDPLLLTTTIITTQVMALMLAYTLMTLLNPMFPTFGKIARCAVPITVLATLLVYGYATGRTVLFGWTFYAACLFFLIQLIAYSLMFRREYSRYVLAVANYFSDLDNKRLQWILTAFFMALGLGVAVAVSLFLPAVYFVVMMALVTLFFVFYAIRYIGYTKVYRQVAAALDPVFEEVEGDSASSDGIVHRVEEWIGRKGFSKPGVTIDAMAKDIGIDRTLIVIYLNRNAAKTFRRWITGLRIEEAREQIMDDPRVPLSQVGEGVGIRKRRAFYHSFLKVTGEDARDFRDRMLSVRNH